MKTVKLSELNKGDKFKFPNQKETCIFLSSYDDIMSKIYKYSDCMGFELTHSVDLIVLID